MKIALEREISEPSVQIGIPMIESKYYLYKNKQKNEKEDCCR